MDIKRFYQETNSNYQAALSIMMSDALIERMIKKFMENNSYKAIIEAYEAGNIKDVFALSHSFKGVTGNLALTRLFNIASVLTEATRDVEVANIDKEIEELKEAYQVIEKVYNSLA